MSNLTFNRNDWSGEQLTIPVNRATLQWEQSGYHFKLAEVANDKNDELGMSMTTYQCTGSGWSQPLFNIIKFSTSSEWLAVSGDIMIENNDPIACAAQMICNIV